MIRSGSIALLHLSVLLASCATPTGRSYPVAVRETTRFLEAKSPRELFNLQIQENKNGTEFCFHEGSKWDKAAVIFPLRVTLALESKDQGARSNFKIRAYQQGLFLKERKRALENQWRTAILTQLHSIPPHS